MSDDLDDLVSLYVEEGISLDDLPYSEQMKSIVSKLKAKGWKGSERDIWLRLLNVRKRGNLPRMFRS